MGLVVEVLVDADVDGFVVDVVGFLVVLGCVVVDLLGTFVWLVVPLLLLEVDLDVLFFVVDVVVGFFVVVEVDFLVVEVGAFVGVVVLAFDAVDEFFDDFLVVERLVVVDV